MEKATSWPSWFSYYWECPSTNGYELVVLDGLQEPVWCVRDHLLRCALSWIHGIGRRSDVPKRRWTAHNCA